MGHFYLAANRNAAASADLTQAASMEESCLPAASINTNGNMPVALVLCVHAPTHSIAVSSGMRSAARVQASGTCEQAQDPMIYDRSYILHLSIASKSKSL